MVKVMPIQISAFALRPAQRALSTGLAVAFTILGTAMTAYSAAADEPSDTGLSSILSTYSITILLAVGLVALLVFRKVRSKKGAGKSTTPHRRNSRGEYTPSALPVTTPRVPAVVEDRRIQGLQPAQQWEKPGEVEPEVFGAYRIDQEVTKLALGKPHRMDVMASRATEDRRAIEASPNPKVTHSLKS